VIRDRREKKMSFIKIIEEKNPIEMHNRVYEASKKDDFTPEFCMEILSHTNMPIIMKEMLEKIEKLPIEEQGEYIEVILSMFDYRQTSEKVRDKALEIAKNNGFENELVGVIDKTRDLGYPARVGCDKIYVIDKAGDYRDVDFSDYERVIVKGKLKKEITLNENNSLKGVLDLRGAKNVVLRGCDLSKVTQIIFEDGGDVILSEATNLPKDLDVSMCDEVNLSECDLRGINLKFRKGASVYLAGATNLDKDLDVSMCDEVGLYRCNLEGINLKFREGASVYLAGATNLDKDLDLSMCDYVDLSQCDLDGLNLKFRKGAEVYLVGAKNLPTNLDVSMCGKVDLSQCDLKGIDLKFRERAQVYLNETTNLPTDLDVSMCDVVNLRKSDLRGVNELKFKEGAYVDLCFAKNLPTNLDVSMCQYVCLGDCDVNGVDLKFRERANVYLAGAKNLPTNLDVSMCESVLFSGRTDFGVMYADISNVKELKVKNHKQLENSLLKIPEGWKGKIIYTDDEKPIPVISRGNEGR